MGFLCGWALTTISATAQAPTVRPTQGLRWTHASVLLAWAAATRGLIPLASVPLLAALSSTCNKLSEGTSEACTGSWRPWAARAHRKHLGVG
jgi:hypothetical protein